MGDRDLNRERGDWYCWRLAVTLLLLVFAGHAVAQAPPSSWIAVAADAELPANVTMHRSLDRRCSVTDIRAESSGALQDVLEPILFAELEAAGFTLSKKATEGHFARGAVIGRYRLNLDETTAPKEWHLRACIYRKRDENVCHASCNKLL